MRYHQLEETNYVLREIYEGVCENHSRARLLVRKVVRQGYFVALDGEGRNDIHQEM